MAMKDALLPEFDHEMGTTRKLLERVPEPQLGWKPHDKSMSLGELATHVATLPGFATMIMTSTSFDIAGPMPPNPVRTSRADLLSAFDTTVRDARANIDRSDAEFLVMWSLTRGDQELFSIPRAAAVRSWALNHSIHHRGQLSVYLRLLNVPLPPIYGPSADES